MTLTKRQTAIFAIIAIGIVVGLINAERVGVLGSYAASRIAGASAFKVGGTELSVPKDAWVLTSDGRTAVIAFLWGLGNTHELHVFARPHGEVTDVLTPRLDSGMTVSRIEAVNVDRVGECFAVATFSDSVMRQRAMYCPTKGVLFVVEEPNMQAWSRIPEILQGP